MPVKTAPIERRLQNILAKHAEIDRLSIVVGKRSVSISAIPNPNHPLVRERRETAVQARGGSVSITEATEINNASMGPVARGHASDFDGAVISLQNDLRSHDPR